MYVSNIYVTLWHSLVSRCDVIVNQKKFANVKITTETFRQQRLPLIRHDDSHATITSSFGCKMKMMNFAVSRTSPNIIQIEKNNAIIVTYFLRRLTTMCKEKKLHSGHIAFLCW